MTVREHWSNPSAKERAMIDFVLNPPPEPPRHRCGNCGNNPFGRSSIPCPNDRSASVG